MTGTDFTIRPAEAADLAVIVEYNARLAEETEDLVLDRATLEAGVDRVLSPGSAARYFVAEAAGKVIGQIMVTYEWSDWRNGPIWWLQSVYVDSEWRGAGVFRALYNSVIQAGKSDGAVGFRLYVVSENNRAQEAYRRLGMAPTHYVVWECFPEL